jgi:CHASE3 domain sensor protein
MKSIALIKMVVGTALLLLLVGAVGFVSIGHLKRNARVIVEDTLPGLTHASTVNAELAQGYNDLMVFLLTDSPAERETRRRAIEETRQEITRHLAAYEKAIFDETQDRGNFSRLVDRRQHCYEIRLQLMALVKQGDRAGALRVFEREYQPAYKEFREAGAAIMEYNIKQGEERGREILTICSLTQVFVAFVGVFLFLAGFFFGLFR